jgi:hypothetical protein
MHRLWYHLRAQSLFETSFRADVSEIDKSLERMIWRILSQYAELAGSAPAVCSEVALAMFDGLFQQSLLKHLFGNDEAGRQLRDHAEDLMDRLILSP